MAVGDVSLTELCRAPGVLCPACGRTHQADRPSAAVSPGICGKEEPNTSAGSLLRDPLRWLNAQLLLDSVSGLLRWLDYLRFLLAR